MNYDGLELELRQIVERRLEEGWEVTPGLTCSMNHGCCCLIGAIGIEEHGGADYPDKIRMAASRFLDAHGVPNVNGWGNALEAGFEAREDFYGPLYDIGARIRRDYCVEE